MLIKTINLVYSSKTSELIYGFQDLFHGRCFYKIQYRSCVTDNTHLFAAIKMKQLHLGSRSERAQSAHSDIPKVTELNLSPEYSDLCLLSSRQVSRTTVRGARGQAAVAPMLRIVAMAARFAHTTCQWLMSLSFGRQVRVSNDYLLLLLQSPCTCLFG